MDFIKCVEGRRSIRKFTKQKVEHEKFEKIVSIASFSPLWKNTQTVRYTLLEDKQIIDNIADNCVMGFKFNTSICLLEIKKKSTFRRLSMLFRGIF